MKRIILSIFCTYFIISLNAQSPQFGWAKQIGGSSSEIGLGITTDASGNVYSVGSFNGTVDFNPGPAVSNLTANSFDDIYILKLDANGDFVWARNIGESQNVQVKSIAVDKLGNVYISGEFEDSVDFNPGVGVNYITSKGNYDVFILKLDKFGNYVWAKTMGGNNYDILYGAATDSKGNIILTGPFAGTSDFDPNTGNFNLTSAGAGDIYVVKLDSLGTFKWAQQIGGTRDDAAYTLSIGTTDSIYVSGVFSGTVDFNAGAGISNLISQGLKDEFILKLDPSGNFIWVRNYGGPNDGELGVTDISVDGYGNSYSMGYFFETIDFNPGTGIFNLTPKNYGDMYILKLNSNGNFVWCKNIGGDLTVDGNAIITDQSGNSFVTGRFSGNVDFNPGMDSFPIKTNADQAMFILKLNSLGNFEWADAIDGDAFSYCTGVDIALDSKGNIYTTGGYSDAIDFNPGTGIFKLFDAGDGDVFIHKLHESNSSIKSISNSNIITAFPNPSTGIISFKSNRSFKNVNIEIYNTSGVLIYCGFVDQLKSIDLSEKNNGLYFIKITCNGAVETLKVHITK